MPWGVPEDFGPPEGYVTEERAEELFLLGAQAAREMLARFVEQGGDATAGVHGFADKARLRLYAMARPRLVGRAGAPTDDLTPCATAKDPFIDVDMPSTPEPGSFEQELEALINRHSVENDSNAPDFILREYMVECLKAFTRASRQREKWYGRELRIGQ